jgi:hypothetical protein
MSDKLSAAFEPAPGRCYQRRLIDKILVAFDQACDQGNLEVADRLLAAVAVALRTPPSDSREDQRRNESVMAAYQRLWQLHNPYGEPRPSRNHHGDVAGD